MALARRGALGASRRMGAGERGWRLWLALAWRHASQAYEKLGEAANGGQAGLLGAECERFIREHERQILNYVWRMTGNEQAAYDLTQEVFLRAWQHFATVRTYEQPRGWLFRVATNLALNHVRRHSTVAARDSGERDVENEAVAGGDFTGAVAESELVRRTLLQLPPKRRAALVLREVYGLSAEEVGRTLGMTATAVRMALHRGREQFRAIYLREGGADHGA